MTKIHENPTPAQATPPPRGAKHPFTEAKSRRREALGKELHDQLEMFVKYAAPTDMEFLAHTFMEWNGAFMGGDYGLAGAVETLLRGQRVHLWVVSDKPEPGDDIAEVIEPEAAQPKLEPHSGESAEITGLVDQALGNSASEIPGQGKKDFYMNFMLLCAEFFTDAIESDGEFLLRLLRRWKGDNNQDLPELALDLAIEVKTSATFQVDWSCLTRDAENFGTLQAIRESGTWQWEFLSRMLHFWREDIRQTPGDVLRDLAGQYEEFLQNVRTAQRLLRDHPDAVKEDN